jgi:Major intrinsic protein
MPWGSPVSGASTNPARLLGPTLVKGDWTSWWAYLIALRCQEPAAVTAGEVRRHG